MKNSQKIDDGDAYTHFCSAKSSKTSTLSKMFDQQILTSKNVPQKKLRVEKSNVGNHLKRTLANFQAKRSHPRGVNGLRKFCIFLFFWFRFFGVFVGWMRRRELRLWRPADLKLPDVSKKFCAPSELSKPRKVDENFAKILKKSRDRGVGESLGCLGFFGHRR